MSKENKLIITEWYGGENFDGRKKISFDYKCPKCGYENFCIFKTSWLKGKDGAQAQCDNCYDIVKFKIVNNQIEGEQVKVEGKGISVETILALWDSIKEPTEEVLEMYEEGGYEEELEKLIEEQGLDIKKLNKSYLSKLSQQEIHNIMFDLVYIGICGPCGGQFDYMYGLLRDIGLDHTLATELIDF